MSQVNQIVSQVEDTNDGLNVVISSANWTKIRNLLERYVPSLTPIQIGRKYVMQTKKGQVVAQVTKENQKTWVMYEVEGSHAPGTRWMIGKTWCREENIQEAQTEARIPNWVRVK